MRQLFPFSVSLSEYYDNDNNVIYYLEINLELILIAIISLSRIYYYQESLSNSFK